MGKFKQSIDTAGLRLGNTIVTGPRILGEGLNAVTNIPRQGISSIKNIAEVAKQTGNALVDNFLNFSKVQGKWYQRLFKGTVNLASAVTRRPVMIMGAGLASATNQGVFKQFKNIMYTPGKMIKGMRNAFRPLSKKKGFDFAKYTTDDTKEDTLVNTFNEKKTGFFGMTGGLVSGVESEKTEVESQKKEEKKTNDTKEEVSQGTKEEEKKELKPRWKTDSARGGTGRGNKDGTKNSIKKEEEKIEEKKPAVVKPKPVENPSAESEILEKKVKEKDDKKNTEEPISEPKNSEKPASIIPPSSSTPPKSINEIENKRKEDSEKKDKADQEKNIPNWNTLPKEYKAKYLKDYKIQLGENPSPASIIERGKKAKKGDTKEAILSIVKKENPTMAGYMEEIFKAAA